MHRTLTLKFPECLAVCGKYKRFHKRNDERLSLPKAPVSNRNIKSAFNRFPPARARPGWRVRNRSEQKAAPIRLNLISGQNQGKRTSDISHVSVDKRTKEGILS